MFGKANSDNNGVFVFSGQAKSDANVGMGKTLSIKIKETLIIVAIQTCLVAEK